MARLKEFYQKEVIPKLMKELGYTNVMQIPKIEAITLNMGLGSAARDKKILERTFTEMELISGQKPIITQARKSVAGFKIRKGFPIGMKVTLRSYRMFEFLDRLISVVIPRIRDFRGLKKNSLDGQGNFNLGIKEYIVFPEIDYDTVERMKGLDIAIKTSAKNNPEALALLTAFNFPFQKD